MNIPGNYKLIVRIFQYTYCCTNTLYNAPERFRGNQITSFLREDITNFQEVTTISTSSEMHVLRLLRHVREEVDGIKLKPENLEFWFDIPDSNDMIKINPTEDGDLDKNVPGGFFTHREKELF